MQQLNDCIRYDVVCMLLPATKSFGVYGSIGDIWRHEDTGLCINLTDVYLTEDWQNTTELSMISALSSTIDRMRMCNSAKLYNDTQWTMLPGFIENAEYNFDLLANILFNGELPCYMYISVYDREEGTSSSIGLLEGHLLISAEPPCRTLVATGDILKYINPGLRTIGGVSAGLTKTNLGSAGILFKPTGYNDYLSPDSNYAPNKCNELDLVYAMHTLIGDKKLKLAEYNQDKVDKMFDLYCSDDIL